MKNKLSKEKTVILKNVVVAVILIAFFVGVVLAFYNMVYDEKRSNIINNGKMIAMQSAEKFSDYLLTSTDAIKLTAYTVDGMLGTSTNDEILDYLIGQTNAITSTVFENTSGLYGYINGEFLDGMLWLPDDDFVPTERPWYIKALENNGEIAMVEPYLDAQTGTVLMAISKMLGDKQSVVSMDITLDVIQQITEEAVNSGSSDIEFIVNDSGMVIAHSDKAEVGKNYLEETGTIGAEIMSLLNGSDDDHYEFYFRNSHYIAYSAKIENDWRCIFVKDATSVFGPLRIILALTITAILLIVAVISILIINSSIRQLKMERIGNQLASTADIYVSMHEINFVTDTFSEVRNNKAEASEMIGETRNNCQQMIRAIMAKFSDETTRENILDFVDFSKMNDRLKDRNTATCEFLSAGGEWRKARYIVSDRATDGKVARAMYLVEDIDAEKRERDMFLETLRTMNEQISSVANIYLSMHDINLPDDTFSEIRTNAPRIEELNSVNQGHAQQAIYYTMDNMTAETSRQAIKSFIDFSTLNERLKNTNTITEEFLSYRDLWCRARFLVSKRLPDGTIDHVLWLIENIDTEKRRRDKLTDTAMTLNYRISSIANIYMTVHEIDLANDTFSEIKSTLDPINDIVGETRDHAQNMLNKVMGSRVDPDYEADILRFIDLSTLSKRLRKNDTISIEFLNREKLWRRGRFIVSRRDKNGKLTHVMWLSEDIDDEKKERDKLIDMSERALAASEAKSSFLSNMSHEIRTPINAVLGMNEMILRECDDKNIIAYSESIRTAGNTLLGLINDILDFSKIEAGKMEIIPVDYDVSSLINDLVNMIQTRADDKGLLLVLEFDKEMPKLLHGDEVRIKQVITNILTNAVKYTEKGCVTFCMRYERIAEEPDSVYITVIVKDTGIGIKPEDMKKLFSEFERIDEERNRNVEGTGLGMNITKSLLEMMGSSLEVESIYGLGSKFSFRLKQKVVKWEELGDYEAAYKASLGKREKYHEKFTAPDAHVLVVDDTPMNLMVFKSLLKQTKMKIDTAESGDEALKMSYDKKYDMIFLDHMMPEKDGIETLHEMRARKNDPNMNTPVICLTANAISGAREKYLAEGFNDYLTKPIDSSKLEDMLMEYISKDKIGQSGGNEDVPDGNEESVLPDFVKDISELDISSGIKNNGDEESYLEMLKTYAGMIVGHIDEIEKYMMNGDIDNAAIKIHALKSTSRIIGANDIGELAQKLENAGKAHDTETLENELGGLLDRCGKLGEQLSVLIENNTENEELPLISDAELSEAYGLIKEANESFLFDNINEIVENLRGYRIPDAEKERVAKIIEAADEFDYDKLAEILE